MRELKIRSKVITSLGFINSLNKIKPNTEKIQALSKYPIHRTIKQKKIVRVVVFVKYPLNNLHKSQTIEYFSKKDAKTENKPRI